MSKGTLSLSSEGTHREVQSAGRVLLLMTGMRQASLVLPRNRKQRYRLQRCNTCNKRTAPRERNTDRGGPVLWLQKKPHLHLHRGKFQHTQTQHRGRMVLSWPDANLRCEPGRQHKQLCQAVSGLCSSRGLGRRHWCWQHTARSAREADQRQLATPGQPPPAFLGWRRMQLSRRCSFTGCRRPRCGAQPRLCSHMAFFSFLLSTLERACRRVGNTRQEI